MRLDKPLSRVLRQKARGRKSSGSPWHIREDDEGNLIVYNKETGARNILVPKSEEPKEEETEEEE